MTETLDQVLRAKAQKHFAENGITVTDENKEALFEMFKAQYIAGSAIERSHDQLRGTVMDFQHPDRELSNLKAHVAMMFLGDCANGGGVLKDVFHENFQFNVGHRSLERDVLNMIFDLIQYIAENAGKTSKFRVDDRNEYAVDLCRQLNEKFA